MLCLTGNNIDTNVDIQSRCYPLLVEVRGKNIICYFKLTTYKYVPQNYVVLCVNNVVEYVVFCM